MNKLIRTEYYYDNHCYSPIKKTLSRSDSNKALKIAKDVYEELLHEFYNPDDDAYSAKIPTVRKIAADIRNGRKFVVTNHCATYTWSPDDDSLNVYFNDCLDEIKWKYETEETIAA